MKNAEKCWHHICTKQDNACLANAKHICTIHQGKMLGGTSSVNNLLYSRGNNRDFFNWTYVTDDEWNLDDIFAHFKRLEHFERDVDDDFPRDYGREGEIILNRFNHEHYLKDAIFDAAHELKYEPITPERYLGYVEVLGTLNDGKRYNMAKGFLSPIFNNRTNLLVARNVLVTKVLFSDDRKANAVRVIFKNKEYTIRAKKEILLTGDPINTAKLLMLSGIGLYKQLKYFGIPTISNVPTGRHLKAQMALPIFVGLDHTSKLTDEKFETAVNMYNFLVHNSGAYTAINVHDLIGYISTRNQTFNYPDILICHVYYKPNDTNLVEELSLYDYDFDIIKSVRRYNRHNGVLMFKPTLLHPVSEGEVLLTSACHEKPPTVNGNFLSDKLSIDIDMLVVGYKFVESMTETNALQQFHAKLLEIDVPNCRNFKFYTDAYIKCYIKNLAHPKYTVATARMASCHYDGVVDKNLFVYGTRGLRVVGTSAMPTFVSGTLQGTVAMMADKASEMIKDKWIPNYLMFNKKMPDTVDNSTIENADNNTQPEDAFK